MPEASGRPEGGQSAHDAPLEDDELAELLAGLTDLQQLHRRAQRLARGEVLPEDGGPDPSSARADPPPAWGAEHDPTATGGLTQPLFRSAARRQGRRSAEQAGATRSAPSEAGAGSPQPPTRRSRREAREARRAQDDPGAAEAPDVPGRRPPEPVPGAASGRSPLIRPPVGRPVLDAPVEAPARRSGQGRRAARGPDAPAIDPPVDPALDPSVGAAVGATAGGAARTAAGSPAAPAARRGPAPAGPTRSQRPLRQGNASAALARASALMAAGTAISRVLGFVRVAVLAAVIGANTTGSNTFALANTVPNMLYVLIAGGVLNAVLVPQVVKAMKQEDGGEEYLNRLVTAAVGALVVLTALLTLCAPVVVSVAASSSTAGQHALAVAFAYWCLPQVFFYAMYTLLGQILNAKGRFGAFMWAPVINNVVAIIGIGVFAAVFGLGGRDDHLAWSSWQVGVLAGTSTLGVVAQSWVLLRPLRRAGVHLRPRWGLRGMGLGSAGRSSGWVIAGVVVGLVASFANTNVAQFAFSHARAGVVIVGLNAWQNAYLLFMLPHSLVTVSLVTALFTRMSQEATSGQVRAVRADVSYGLRTIAVTTVIGTVGLLVLAKPSAILLTGASPATAAAFGQVIVAMAVGLVPFSANYLVQRAFYAFEDARTPFLMQVIAVSVWILGSLISAALLEPQHVVAGAALSMSAGQLCSIAVGLTWLRVRLNGMDGYRVTRTHARLVVGGLAAALVGLVIAHPLGRLGDSGHVGAAIVAVLVGVPMVVVYALALIVMRVEEVRPLLRRVTRPVARRLSPAR